VESCKVFSEDVAIPFDCLNKTFALEFDSMQFIFFVQRIYPSFFKRINKGSTPLDDIQAHGVWGAQTHIIENERILL